MLRQEALKHFSKGFEEEPARIDFMRNVSHASCKVMRVNAECHQQGNLFSMPLSPADRF